MEKFIKEIILKAGGVLMEHFGKVEVLKSKNDDTVAIVTEADLASDKTITDAIRKTYPDHGFVTEESGKYKEDAEFIWYIDPLDGTKNFES